MITDPIAQFLTEVRNSVHARHKKVDVAASKSRLAVAAILKQSGFIRNYRLYRQNQKGVLRIYHKYLAKDRPAIQGLNRVSKPSRRVYVSRDKLPKVMNGIGVGIISTSKGIVSDQQARELKVGGEFMCSVW